ncbi:MAG: hypothetical protein J1F07_02725 [Muribaculaceae bacterium]|nr:hypothetical protein [Muribaculaceae bacterium]
MKETQSENFFVEEASAPAETVCMRRWHCYLLMLMHQAPAAGWVVGLLCVALVVAGFIVSPWLGVAALGVSAFIAVMAMSFVVMAYGFYTLTWVNMKPHTFSLSGDSLRIVFDDGREVGVALNQLRPYTIYPGGVLVPVAVEGGGWLWFPGGSQPDGMPLPEFLKRLYNHTDKQPADEHNTD